MRDSVSMGGVAKTPKADLPNDRFLNRELSWLAFNERVLAQAADESLPILERAKFLAITSSNLDEFMMVRVGGLKILSERNPSIRDPAGMTAAEQIQAVSAKGHEIVSRQYRILRDEVQPRMESAGLVQADLTRANESQARAAESRFWQDIFPVVSPQAVSKDRFPLLRGLGVQVCVRLVRNAATRLGTTVLDDADLQQATTRLDAGGTASVEAVVADGQPEKGQPEDGQPEDSEPVSEFALIPLGRSLPRVMTLSGDHQYSYILLEQLIAHYVDEFFPGREVVECIPFRLTRNADIELREDDASDLLGGMEEVIESRRYSRPVRLEYEHQASDQMVEFLRNASDLQPEDLYAIEGPLDLRFLFTLHGQEGFDQHRDEVWLPRPSPRIDPEQSMFDTIAQGDLMLVHPYETFDSVVRLIEEAAVDPDVLAIKQVLYRTSKNSPVVAALERAAEHGKYVTAIVELKARFDEARNIEWAREMEHAGVQVIYGIHGLKTHAKICIIVRREPQGIVRYVHFGTGNYNEVTANLYSDISVLTCDGVLGRDATTFFNAVTGASQPREMEELAAAPTSLRRTVLDLIESETARCKQGERARITAKLNALVDTEMIDALYRASQAGVVVRLNVRGQCCLRPGVPGLSETIEVISIVDRFLEHARVFCFRQGGEQKMLISSADWMPRNLDRRVELLVPVNDRECSRRLHEVLETYFEDNTNCWKMGRDGAYVQSPLMDTRPIRAQRVLYDQVVAAWDQADSTRRTTFRPLRASEQ